MITWLYNLIFGQSYAVSGDTRNLIWDALHGFTSWVQKILQNTSDAWQNIYMRMWNLDSGTWGFGQAVYWKFWRLYKQDIPFIKKEASDRSDQIFHWANNYIGYVINRVNSIRSEAWLWIVGLTFMVVHVIIPPIMALLHTLADQMLKWAFVAWDLVTHPPKLASLLFWPLFAIFKVNPFAIGRTIGDWALKLVLAEFIKSSQLVEEIITDVF